MKRIVVLGGLGFFGAAAVQRLRADGAMPLIASRRAAGADLQVDVEDPSSLRAALRPGDVVIDTVGPFQRRTLALVEAALDIGFDLLVIADSLAYVSMLYGLRPQIDATGRRVLTACSSISAISAAMVRLSRLKDPIRVTGVLAPASRYAATPATGASLMRSVGRPIRVLRDGRLVMAVGWRASHKVRMPPPIGDVHGYLFESADSFTLPLVWPDLRRVEFYVDSRVPGLNLVFAAAARWLTVRSFVERFQSPGLALARAFGSAAGCLMYEIEARGDRLVRYALIASDRGYYTPIVPAVLAARAIAEGRFAPRGLVPPDQHVEPGELTDYLRTIGVETVRLT